MLSGHGGGHFHGHGRPSSIHIHNQNRGGIFARTVDIHPDTVLAGVAALGAAGLLAIYIAATQNANGKRRRRRLEYFSPLPTFDYVEPLLVAGKELLSYAL